MFTSNAITKAGIHFTRISINGEPGRLPVYALIDFGPPYHITFPQLLKILNEEEAHTLSAQISAILTEDIDQEDSR